MLSLTEPLRNRRNIAATAARAWEAEADRAEEREAKVSIPLSKEDADIAREFVDEANARRAKDAH
ncbi:hypothetical protein [Parerythrobacter jejuensis]|nr:hypothetical protein [Parerythrobacter jejuensis]